MPFHSKALGAALSIVAVAAVTMAAPARAQQDPPASGQEPVPDAKPQGDPAQGARAVIAQEPAAKAPTTQEPVQAPTAQTPAAPPPNTRPRVAAVHPGPAKSAAVIATVNLRSGPGTDQEVVTTIPAGSMVRITSCIGEWCAVTWNGSSGYAIARNLAPGAPRQARPYGAQPRYAGEYEPEPGVVYGAPGYYAPPPVVYGPAYYGPRFYYGAGWGWRRHW